MIITFKVRTEDLITKQQATFNKVVEPKEELQGWVDITTRLRSMFKRHRDHCDIYTNVG